MPLKLDLHIHSESRGKVFINAEKLRDALQQKKLDGVAITNFSSIAHALWLKEKISDFIIIVGQEIWTNDGHIVGLGLKEKIEDYQSAQETINHIHKQGGIAVAVHPYLSLGIGKHIGSLPVDAVEVYNALMGVSIVHNYLAKLTAERLNIPQLASTDTTDARFVGHSYTEVAASESSAILATIRSGRLKLFKKAIPFPLVFAVKNFLHSSNLEPCSIHAIPCYICGKSMTIGLFKGKFKCLDCGKISFSRIRCCNGHYLCKDCIIKRDLNNNTDYYSDRV